MKVNFQSRWKRYPLATSQKKPWQQWSSLLKLSKTRQRFYKNQTRFFSMEYGRSLTKRLFWQMIFPTHFQKENIKKTLHSQESIFLKSETFEYSWNVFRTGLFGKMWILNNPSLVPGVVWPAKSKKILLAKMRAFKALSHLTGNIQQKRMLSLFRKFYDLSMQTTPFLWSVARNLDSLRFNFVLKSGFVSTLPSARHSVNSAKWLWNGTIPFKTIGFTYPGDFVQNCAKSSQDYTKVFSELFCTGPSTMNSKATQGTMVSLYKLKPFFWCTSFFHTSHFQKH